MIVKEVPLDLSEGQVRTLLYYAAMHKGVEVCGVIYRNGQIEQLPNEHEHPDRAFDMQIDLEAPIEYVWHSHPRGRPDPSADDHPHMLFLEESGHHYKWLVIAAGDVKCFEVVL